MSARPRLRTPSWPTDIHEWLRILTREELLYLLGATSATLARRMNTTEAALHADLARQAPTHTA